MRCPQQPAARLGRSTIQKPQRRRIKGTPIWATALGRSPHIIERHYDVTLPLVPEDADLIIGHLSDLHIGRVTPEGRLEAAVQAVNEMEVDLVCLTGDFIAHSLRYLARLTHNLAQLQAPAYAVLGNHDHWHGPDEVAEALRAANVRVLINEREPIEIRGRRWQIVGLDDPVTEQHDVEKAFAEVNEDDPILLLSHLAETSRDLEGHRAALVLSGHTHGGQVHVKGLTERIMKRMGHDYIMGWYDAGPTGVYVNRGIGAAVFPWRTKKARAEVARIHVRGRHDPMQITQH